MSHASSSSIKKKKIKRKSKENYYISRQIKEKKIKIVKVQASHNTYPIYTTSTWSVLLLCLTAPPALKSSCLPHSNIVYTTLCDVISLEPSLSFYYLMTCDHYCDHVMWYDWCVTAWQIVTLTLDSSILIYPSRPMISCHVTGKSHAFPYLLLLTVLSSYLISLLVLSLHYL